ncbi:MAG: beta-lactamase family protein [bacterium]|nr:beta-lactamase family protein [bacterium]
MKMKCFGNYLLVLLFILFLAGPPAVFPQDAQNAQGTGEEETAPAPEPVQLSQSQIEKIEAFVKLQMTVGKIPGMSVVIVKGDQTVYEKGFGFADLEKQAPVTPATLFELGSTSKAFTGLGILQLEKKGLLKLSDPVEKYLPWLKLKYRGKDVSPTVAHFVHISCGVPFETIGGIPEAEGDDALEKTVRKLVGTELRHEPGSRHFYATINYDVLGLIIQELSGEPFEEYMKKNVLLPLGLKETYLFRDEAGTNGMSLGYKLCFSKPAVYDAPVYRGNTPAGYFITNARDLGKWLKIQMGTVDPPQPTYIDKEIIEKSHVSDPSLTDSNYAVGWYVFRNTGAITHGGTNPNFSSFIAFAPGEIGVAVLSNRNTDFTTGTGRGIMAVMRGADPEPSHPGYDMNMSFDALSSKIVYILLPLLFLGLLLLLLSLFKIVRKKKRFYGGKIKGIVAFVIATGLMAVWAYVVSIIPTFFGFNLPLSFGFVWMPFTFTYAILAIFLLGFLYYLFFLSAFFFRKPRGAAQ